MKYIEKSKNEEMIYKKQEKDKKREKKVVGKKGKEGPKGYHPRWAQTHNNNTQQQTQSSTELNDVFEAVLAHFSDSPERG